MIGDGADKGHGLGWRRPNVDRVLRVLGCAGIENAESGADMMNADEIRELLKQVRYPGFSRDIVSFGLVKAVEVTSGDVTVSIEVTTKDAQVPQTIFKDVHDVLGRVEGIDHVKVDIEVKDAPEAVGGATGKSSIPGVKRIIAVASGKGGVGKSTVAANLAVALAARGLKVGLCDCDLYGPSVAQMFGTNERPNANEHDEIIPIEAHGLKLMSMGFLLEDKSPVIVRGPMATRYTQQFLRQVAWGELDVLVLDLPPGTGDIQLTIVQTVAVDGAVIVTTPQEVALIDARKAVAMFAKVNVPILGLIENMAWFEGDDGKKYHIFGEGGGVREAEGMNVPLLAQIPIDLPTGRGGDEGTPIALLSPMQNKVSAAFHAMVAGLNI